jgi:uncharacterized membrane protein
MSLVKDFLQGKWLGHPLHPALVHVPTGLFPAALIFDVVAIARDGDAAAERCAFWCIAVGLIAALAAAPTGLADWWEIKPGKPARRLGIYHMAMNVVVLILMAIGLYLRRDGWTTTAALTLNVVGNLVLFVSGYVGGRMVFDNGIAVARMSKKKWRKIAEAAHARVPPPNA